jgi:glucan-binding YG repeat protein
MAGDTETTVTDEQAVDFAANDLVSSIPSSTDKALTLPATGAYDANISWSSSDVGTLANDGTVTRPENINKEVTLTATITKGSATITKAFKVTVLGVLTSLDVEPTYKYEFNTDSASDISNSGSATGNATLKGTASIVKDEDRGNVLQIKNTGGTKANYLALPSTTFSGITNKGYTVSMWVNVDESDPNYLENSALFEANAGGQGAYPMTRIGANLFARINASTGWIDTGATGLPSNTWKYVTYTVDPTGISVYVNGKQVNRSNKDISASFQNNVLAGMTDVRVGSGNIFGDSDLASAKFDNVAVYNTALTAQQVEALYNQEAGLTPPAIPAINSVVTTPASVTLTPGETKQLTATVDAVGGTAETVTWSSNDTSNKVTVDQDGLVSVKGDAELGDYKIKAVSTADSSKFGTTTVKVVSVSDNQGGNNQGGTDQPGTTPSNTDTLEITKQPISQTVRKGNTARFTIEVKGTAPFNYQWQKDEKDLEDGNGISGANKAILEINSVKKSDAGEYRCIVADEIGNITTSSAVKLTVRSNSSSSSSSNSNSTSSTTTSSSTDASGGSNANTIVITLNNITEPNQTNESPIISQDIIADLRTHVNKTLVVKIGNESIEIKNKNGQLQFTQNGAVISGFKALSQTQYFLDSNGIMQTGWVQTSGDTWYYFDKGTGAMKRNWLQDINGSWYFLDHVTGIMKKGWLQDINGSWYFLNRNSGQMQTGWIKDNEKWYYLKPDGSLAVSTTIDGYVVNENGEWAE